jgi:hypothetical protein
MLSSLYHRSWRRAEIAPRTPHKALTLSAQPCPGAPYQVSLRVCLVGSHSSAPHTRNSSIRIHLSGLRILSRFTLIHDWRTWSNFRLTASSRATAVFSGSAGIFHSLRITTPQMRSSFRIRGRPRRLKMRPTQHHLTNVRFCTWLTNKNAELANPPLIQRST